MIDIEQAAKEASARARRREGGDCMVCREIEQREERNTCHDLEGNQWCAHGWHWEPHHANGHDFDNAVVMCPNELARLRALAREKRARQEGELAAQVASEATSKRNVATMSKSFLKGDGR